MAQHVLTPDGSRLTAAAWLLVLLTICPSLEAGVLNLHDPARLTDRESVQWFARGAYFEGNNYTAQKAYTDDWHGAYTPSARNLATLQARVSSGVNWHGWQVAAIYRKHVFVLTNRDTTDLMHSYYNDASEPGNRPYQIDLDIHGFQANGMRVSKAWSLPVPVDGVRVRAGAAVSVLDGHMMREGTLTGAARLTDPPQLNLALQDAYSDDRYPFLQPGAPDAAGYALDLAAHFQWQQTRLSLVVNDAIGRLFWEDMPYTEAVADTDNQIVQADGRIRYQPVLSGHNDVDRRKITYQLHPQWSMGLQHQYHDWTFSAQTDYYQGIWLPQLSAGYSWWPQWSVRVSYDLFFGSRGVRLQSPWAYVSLNTQSRDFNHSRAYGIAAGVNWMF